MMIKKWVKSTLSMSAFSPLAQYYQGVGTVLTYHRITDDNHYNFERDFYHHGMITHKDNFEKQMQYLSKNYHCLDISTVISLLQKDKLPKKTVLVTFDDGYKDNLTLALPILKKYSIPAIIYVTTGFINNESILWWYEINFIIRRTNEIQFEFQGTHYNWKIQTQNERQKIIEEVSELVKAQIPVDQIIIMKQLRALVKDKFDYSGEFLTWEEIKKLDKEEPLITIGSHTHNHPCLRILDDKMLMQELLLSKQLLEEKLHHPILHFAYPFGEKTDANYREFLAAQSAGYASAMTTRFSHIYPEHKKNLFALPRIETNYLDTIDDFIWKISGWDTCYRNKGKRGNILT